MSYTDADVERVAEVIWNNQSGSGVYSLMWHEALGEAPLPQEVYETLNIARAALEAMAREPLEDVLRAQHVYNIQIEPAGPNYYAEVVSAAHDRRTGTGATIEEAIRAAVADAKGDE